MKTDMTKGNPMKIILLFSIPARVCMPLAALKIVYILGNKQI